MCAERARKEARDVLKNDLQPFSKVKDHFRPDNNTVEDFNDLLKEMGETELLDPKDYSE